MEKADTSPAFTVHQPPVAYPELAATGGRVGPEPEDFRVDEVPAYAASGKGEHQYLRVQKRLLTTPDLVRRVGRALGVNERDIGYAGMKDKHAVTTQWLSICTKQEISPELDLGDGAKVLEVARHDNKLRTGHLLGNRFTITLVGVHEDAAARANAIAARLREDGLPNYFGVQRFGNGGRNLPDALRWLARGGRSRNRFEQKLFPSVVQSELFNRYLTARLAQNPRQLLEGEVVRLHGAGAMFRVENVAQEQPRLDARDLHLTGPMFGPKLRPAAAAALELEQRMLAELELDENMLGVLGKNAPGTRRDLYAPLADLELEPLAERNALRLSFTLPAGGYATEVLRQLTHEPFSSGAGHSQPPAAEAASDDSTGDD